MHYGTIKNCDIANGPGVRVTLFVSGCRIHCEGCFQPQTWAFDYGQPFDAQAEETVLRLLKPAWIRGLTVLGGEPFEPSNQEALLPFLRRVRQAFPAKDIWLFTGFTFELLTAGSERCRCPETPELLALADVLVDGPFRLAERDLTLRFRGSRNQRLLDLPSSLRAGHPVPWKDEPLPVRTGRGGAHT